jgi:hypothetical protein
MRVEISPDTKDWTWVLEEACPECGFDTRQPERDDLSSLVVLVAAKWQDALSRSADPRTRPEPQVWSPLEYACHVRDVFALADYRVRLMLDEADPLFANWDQDQTAIEDDYASQDPDAVAGEIAAAASGFAASLDVVGDDWQRPGRRSDGAAFTVESFARYLLHDPIHHLTDVTQTRWDAST